MKIKAIRVKTRYWKPGTNYKKIISDVVTQIAQKGDVISLSEKSISTAKGRLVDENNINPSILAKLISRIWIRKIWGGPLGRMVNFKSKTIENLKNYPIKEGAAHKQTTLSYVGLLQTLRHYSEGGIDASNLPFNYVSLPLENPKKEAYQIRRFLENIGKNVTVMIVDGDTTYSWNNLHLAPRKIDVHGIIHFGGFLAFVFGRILGFRARATPLAISGDSLNPDRALWLADLAHDTSGPGAGRTVWGMAERLGTDLTGVTWEMLEDYDHAPIVVLRIRNDN